MCQFTIATVKCAPLMFSCCLRVCTKLLFIAAGYFHVMLRVITSLIKPSKLSKILVYNRAHCVPARTICATFFLVLSLRATSFVSFYSHSNRFLFELDTTPIITKQCCHLSITIVTFLPTKQKVNNQTFYKCRKLIVWYCTRPYVSTALRTLVEHRSLGEST